MMVALNLCYYGNKQYYGVFYIAYYLALDLCIPCVNWLRKHDRSKLQNKVQNIQILASKHVLSEDIHETTSKTGQLVHFSLHQKLFSTKYNDQKENIKYIIYTCKKKYYKISNIYSKSIPTKFELCIDIIRH